MFFSTAIDTVMEAAVWPAAGSSSRLAMVAALVMAVVWVSGQLLIRRGSGRLPPGPWGLPLVGNLLQLKLAGELPHRAMATLSKKYGPIVLLKLGTASTILVSDPSLARACMSGENDKIFSGRPPMEITRRLPFGTFPGLVMAPYGHEWREARKLYMLQLFTTKRVSEFEPIRRGEIAGLVGRIEKQVGQPVDLTHAMASLVERTTCKMLLGKTLPEIVDAQLGVDMQTLVRHLDQLFQKPMIGDFIPALSFLDRKIKASLDEVRDKLNTLLSILIHERQHLPTGSPQAIVDVLLGSLEIDKAKTSITELIGASVATSSAAMEWAMIELVWSPQAMTKLQKELDQLTKGERRMIEEHEVGNLVFLKAVLKETMRLHPPAPLLIPHMSTKECDLVGYRIPKETRLIVNAWAIGRDPKVWKEPERFMPERFLTKEGTQLDFRGQHFEFLPFGGGRRVCPGIPLALPLLHTTIANLVHNFGWTLPSNHHDNLNERFGAIVTSAHPLMVIPHLRFHKS